MFNTNDKFTFVVLAYDENNGLLPYSQQLPIEGLGPDLPEKTDYVSLFEYCETSDARTGKTVFSIYTGKEFLGEKVISSIEENLFDGNMPNLIGKTDVPNFWNKRCCFKVDPETGKYSLRAVLKSDDRVVDDRGQLHAIIYDISLQSRTFNKSIQKIKTIGIVAETKYQKENL